MKRGQAASPSESIGRTFFRGLHKSERTKYCGNRTHRLFPVPYETMMVRAIRGLTEACP